ncbi:MAG: ComEC/Rec2 family competence protein [Pirellulaceae bacterium]|nr:ComEC/Rec2 family competence protein [Pirellulaceae bacterium]
MKAAANQQSSARVYHPLLLLLIAVAVGIAVDRWWPQPALVWLGAGLGALALWLPLWLARCERLASACLLAAWLMTGAGWGHDQWNLFREDEIGRMVREEIRPIAVEALAITSPRWIPAPTATALRTIPKGDETEVYLWITAVRDGPTWRPASGWALMDVDGHLLGVRAGDRIRIMALGSRPQLPLNPGDFNYAAYERSRRLWCRLRGLFPDSVTVVERGSPWSPRLALSKIRQQGTALLRRTVGPRRSTLAAAILLGAREQLDPERNEGFLVTGTIHVLSISGLHVGILAWGFWAILRTGLLPRRGALVGAIFLTIAYALLTDLQAPVLRATVLVVAMCLAQLAGRIALGFNTLAAAGLVVLAYQPASLFMAGPQLSFLAVAVMILFAPLINPPPSADPLDRLIRTTRPWPTRAARFCGGYVWRLWLTGAVIWLISLPIVWKQYNLISPVALFINTLIWLPITLALYGGFAVLIVGALVPPLGPICGWVCDVNLAFMEGCIEFCRGWPGSYFWLPGPPTWWIATFYAGLALVCVLPAWRPRWYWSAGLLAAWTGAALWLAVPLNARRPDERPLACTFVSVGHGVCCLVELPTGETILYDAGKLGSPLGAARPAASVLWSRGITHLDAVIVSHGDSDHFNGVPELLDRFSVGAVYVSPVMFERPQPAVDELRRAIEAARVPLKAIHAGDRLDVGRTRLEVLHPPRKGVIGSDNANSILLLVEHAGRRVLLTGDLESPGLEDVCAEDPLDCDIVMAPHHGSRRSDPAGFALWSTPELVVISGGRNVEDIPDIEAVKDSYRARGAEVFHTAENGCIRFEIDRAGIRTTTFRRQASARARP